MKENQVANSKSGKRIASVVAGVLVVALLLAGTYAWYSFDQSELNEFSGEQTDKDVELVDIFDPDSVVPGADANKDVYVKNTGEGTLYVRVKLDEVMDLTSITPKAATDTHIPDDCAEDCGDTYHDYFEWVLGNNVITMAEYNTKTDDEKTAYVGWVYDTDGYAYWSQPLEGGTQTSLLLDAVKVSSELEDYDFYYAINVSLEAVDVNDLPMWTEGAKSVTDNTTTTDKATDDAKDMLENLNNNLNDNNNNNSNIIIDNETDIKYLPTDVENVYEVLNDDGTSKSPQEYIYDLEGTLATDGSTHGNEYICDVNGYLYNIAANFPDAAFRTVLISKTTGLSTNITTKEDGNVIIAAGVTGIAAANKGISDLTGIECFVNLASLGLYGNSLTSLDVTQNTALTTLTCGMNQLSSLDVTKNTALTTLDCHGNSLTSLDVTKNTALKTLQCYSNSLTSLDVTKNTALTILWCFSNNLTSLDVTQNTALTRLLCYDNKIKSLNISKTSITSNVNCEIHSNGMTSLTINSTQNAAGIGTEGNTTGNSLTITVV